MLKSKMKKDIIKNLKENNEYKISLCKYGNRQLLESLEKHKIELEMNSELDRYNNYCSHFAANEGNVFVLD